MWHTEELTGLPDGKLLDCCVDASPGSAFKHQKITEKVTPTVLFPGPLPLRLNGKKQRKNFLMNHFHMHC